MKRTNTAVWLDKYNRWQIKVQKDGIRKTFTSSTPGRNGQRECNKKADEWLDDNITDSKLKVSDMSKRYMEQLKITTSQSHWRQYESYFNNWINPTIGNVRIENITENHLQNVINKAYQKGLAKKTLSNIKTCELNFLKYCRKDKTTTLYVEGLFVPKGATPSEKHVLQPEDIKTLFEIDTKLHGKKRVDELYINAYRFEVITGLRVGEAIGLKHFDIKNGVVYLQRAINCFGEVTNGKNENAKRNFALTNLAKLILLKQQTKLNELGIKSEYVFCDKYGEAIKQRNYYRHWKKYSADNGITETTPYELRHTFVSAVKQLPEAYLKPIIGHSKDMDSLGTYSHEQNGDLVETANMIEKIFSKILNEKSGE